MKKIAANFLARTESALEITQGMLRDLPNIIIYGTERIDIDNFKSLLDFSQTAARLNTSDGIVRIDGIGLAIAVMTDESVSIKGTIKLISFE